MNATLLRLGGFIGALLLFGALEWLWPWRAHPGWRHKAVNLGMAVVDSIVVRLVIPVSLIEVSVQAQRHAIGLLPLAHVPRPIAGIAGFLMLDATIYAQHLVFHRVPWLWRLHRVHHTDPSLDVTSGVRFHPLEIAISAVIKAAAILAFGVPALAVLLFEVVLNVTSLFNHANMHLPRGLEQMLRLAIVTPAMHRVHHSAVRGELDHNYSFNFSWWDRLFRTYLGCSSLPEQDMPVGLPGQAAKNYGLAALLLMPFRRSR